MHTHGFVLGVIVSCDTTNLEGSVCKGNAGFFFNC